MKRIYFVDDDHGPMEMYVDELVEAGFDVVRCDKITQVLEHLDKVALKEDRFADLYVVDLMMPPIKADLAGPTNYGMISGLYLWQQIKNTAQAVNVLVPPVILTTAVSNPSILNKIEKGERLQVIAKLDCLPSELAEKVSSTLKERKLQ